MNLKDDKQQNIQKQLDFSAAPTGEAPRTSREGTESSGARSETEKPASIVPAMLALPISNRRVRTRTHGGVAGVDGQPSPLCRSISKFPSPCPPTLSDLSPPALL